MRARSELFFPMLTSAEFVAWLKARRKRESLAAIGGDMGVSRITVALWLNGKRKPSKMALRLGRLLADNWSWPL